MQQFDELILREVSKELQRRFPQAIFSVTQVHVSKDLSFAKVWVSSFQDVDALVEDARKEAGDMRKVLAKTVVARRVPSLYFVADKTEDQAMKLDKLIEKVKENKDDTP
mgnify:CR=1 FL=1